VHQSPKKERVWPSAAVAASASAEAERPRYIDRYICKYRYIDIWICIEIDVARPNIYMYTWLGSARRRHQQARRRGQSSQGRYIYIYKCIYIDIGMYSDR